MSTRYAVPCLLVIVALLMPVSAVFAVPPSPEAKAKFISEGTWEQKVANLKAFEASLPDDMYAQSLEDHFRRYRSTTALGAEAVDTVRIVVLMVDFPDFHYDAASYPIPGGGSLTCNVAATPAMFDSLLFSRNGIDAVYNPTGSMTEWYLENSYGNYLIQGDVYGWFRMPNDYSWYVGANDGLSNGSVLAAHAVLAADPTVNFAQYAIGTSVPGVVVIHAGPGAEQGAYGIWSHRSSMSPSQNVDGVWLSGYTMQPEERFNQASIVHMGVFCHEWGHVLGVQDWYDVAYNEGSEGLGDWCVMAGGSWNEGGRLPSHFNCWSKYLVGFNDMQFLEANFRGAPIPQAETSPISYCLRENPTAGGGGEFWFVENRQQVGFDASLPGRGLLIYHFDPVMANQTNPDRYRLALEEADGRRDLAYAGSGGQVSDPFPGSTNNRTFHGFTVPDSRTNDGEVTQVSVLNISDSDSIMYADLNVYYAMPYLVMEGDSLTMTDNAPDGNGDGAFEQGETVKVHLEVRNIMKMSYWPVMHLDVDNPDIEILQNDKSMGTALNPITTSVNYEPIVFSIPEDFISSLVTFTFTITSDSAYGSGDHVFTNTFEFDMVIGRTQILLVDDDDGYGNDYDYRQALDRLGLPFEHWDKSISGSPDYASLSDYPLVFWMTGDYWPPSIVRGTLTTDDVTFLKQLLDNGGNLLLGSPSAPDQLQALDSAFMADYLHANLTGSQSRRWFFGHAEHTIGGGLNYTTRNGLIWNETTPTLAPTNGGQPAFTLTNYGTGDYGYCGITYDGSYRTAFLSFAVEFLDPNLEATGYAPPDSLIVRALKFFARGAATGVEDDSRTNTLPTDFALDQNYPNPFNPTTIISYSIPTGGGEQVNLSIFNVLGQKVATLVDQVQGPGYYTVTWEGTGADGSRAASGVYFYRLTQGEKSDTKKMVLLK